MPAQACRGRKYKCMHIYKHKYNTLVTLNKDKSPPNQDIRNSIKSKNSKEKERHSFTQKLTPHPTHLQPKRTVISNGAHRRTAQVCLVGSIDRWQKWAVSSDKNTCTGLEYLVQWDAGILKAFVRSLPGLERVGVVRMRKEEIGTKLESIVSMLHMSPIFHPPLHMGGQRYRCEVLLCVSEIKRDPPHSSAKPPSCPKHAPPLTPRPPPSTIGVLGGQLADARAWSW